MANLPPEMPRILISRALEKYGKVGEMCEELWSQAYHYKVSSGVLIVFVDMTKHIPSQILIGGHRALISYEGQPMTCYACNESGHLIQQCPSRQRTMRQVDVNRITTWATLIEQEEGSLQAQSSRAHDTGKRIRDLDDKEKQARERKEEIEMTGLPAKLDNEVTVQKTQESRGDREQSSQPAGMEGTEQKDVDDRKTEQSVEEGRSKGEKGAQGLFLEKRCDSPRDVGRGNIELREWEAQ